MTQEVTNATARLDAARALQTQALADRSQARLRRDAGAEATALAEITNAQLDIAHNLTRVRNATSLVQLYGNLNTARQELVPDATHHIQTVATPNPTPPPHGEFDSRL
jgi:acyl-CoA hydrolase